MKYMLMMNAPMGTGAYQINSWSPEDIKSHIGHMQDLNKRLKANGEFVEVMPDSLETEETRRNKPQYRSDAGRIVYGGGAITPDVIARPDTLTSAEQRLVNALAPQGQLAIHGELWQAVSDLPLQPGDEAQVTGIEGLRLSVKPVPKKEG